MHLHLNYSDRIIRCFGISLDRKTNEYLLIMQYANDGDLQSYLKENFKNLTWNDKKKLAFQIADGLNCLHNENILHRDLHSKNIVIHENNAKITDFDCDGNGLGISIYNGAREDTIPGTPEEYEILYKNCWNKEPEERPTINKILDEFKTMGLGNIVTSNLVKGLDNLTLESQTSDQLNPDFCIDD
ncbi:unnamed protein product [Rhizophagus irregularis]|nr:unnamed protein product [Rhizophagus irregularis]